MPMVSSGKYMEVQRISASRHRGLPGGIHLQAKRVNGGMELREADKRI